MRFCLWAFIALPLAAACSVQESGLVAAADAVDEDARVATGVPDPLGTQGQSDAGGAPYDADIPPDLVGDADPRTDSAYVDFPSHVPPKYLGEFCDIALERSSTLDTDKPTLLMNRSCSIAVEKENGGLAVLVVGVHDFSISPAAKLVLTGTMPIVIVASGAVKIDGIIDGSAILDRPGPGGAASGRGMGHGTDGIRGINFNDGGGGGASHGGAGMPGGDPTEPSEALGGSAGPTYPAGNATLTTAVLGGSGGGAGGSAGCARSRGGAGGGSVQITSAVAIVLGPRAAILVGGGGGAGGCFDTRGEAAGGGGGSGGAIFLEAPTMKLAPTSVLAANGGAGGGAANGQFEGLPGQNGLPSAASAMGGQGSIVSGASGNGGQGASTASPATRGGSGLYDGGGGGGGLGRIVIRARATQDLRGIVSPRPSWILDL